MKPYASYTFDLLNSEYCLEKQTLRILTCMQSKNILDFS